MQTKRINPINRIRLYNYNNSNVSNSVIHKYDFLIMLHNIKAKKSRA